MNPGGSNGKQLYGVHQTTGPYATTAEKQAIYFVTAPTVGWDYVGFRLMPLDRVTANDPWKSKSTFPPTSSRPFRAQCIKLGRRHPDATRLPAVPSLLDQPAPDPRARAGETETSDLRGWGRCASHSRTTSIDATRTENKSNRDVVFGRRRTHFRGNSSSRR